jgi:BirA family biotin operon repressor/biotin-[acetyl-CoA-carboxylase] ligase
VAKKVEGTPLRRSKDGKFEGAIPTILRPAAPSSPDPTLLRPPSTSSTLSRDQTPPDLAAALAATTDARGVFGARLFYAAEVTSTNDLATAAAERGDPEGTTFVAGAQTAGRGRLGRTWFSPPGAGLYISTIVRRRSVAPWLTLAGGVAVADGIRAATGLPLQIKWPNDIVAVGGAGFRARRKLAGILAEASSGPDGLSYIVLGIGINLRTASFPPELADRATAIETELGRDVDSGLVLAEVLASLNRALSTIDRDGPAPLLAQWTALAPSASGAAIEFDGPGGPEAGVTAGLAEDGALLARTSRGLARIIAGEVRWK